MSIAAASPTIAAALAEGEAVLAAAGVETPRADAEWLMAGLLGTGRAAIGLNARRPLGAVTADRYEDAVRRRARREPLQRILGWEEFRGLRFRLTPDVLVPRPETEMLVERALALLPPAMAGARLRAIDLGTGSGCIACALAATRRDLDVTALDVSPAAARVARANARALGLGIRVVVADLLTTVAPASIDLVVANLPYVPDGAMARLTAEVVDHEPRLALVGGADGLDVIRGLPGAAFRVLRAGGAVVLEAFGAAQAERIATWLGDAGFVDVVPAKDLAGVTRFVAGRRP
jgi:release factor glutamine methyltransferase